MQPGYMTGKFVWRSDVVQALTKGWVTPGVASTFACVCSYWEAWEGGGEGGEGGGVCGVKDGRKGWRQEQELPKVHASYCCNPPLTRHPL